MYFFPDTYIMLFTRKIKLPTLLFIIDTYLGDLTECLMINADKANDFNFIGRLSISPSHSRCVMLFPSQSQLMGHQLQVSFFGQQSNFFLLWHMFKVIHFLKTKSDFH